MGSTKRFTGLLHSTRKALDCMGPLVRALYKAVQEEGGGLQCKKADKSFFSIADVCVQVLLTDHLLRPHRFAAIVCEEDAGNANLTTRPYTVGHLQVPAEFCDELDRVRAEVQRVGDEVQGVFKDTHVFIDPIDGTKEFCTGKGEQCSVCVGFAVDGRAHAGIVYRPIPRPNANAAAGAAPSSCSFAMGCKAEGLCDLSQLCPASSPNPKGVLTTNGEISPFLEALIADLGAQRVRCGGVGNKVLMLLEGFAGMYVQDRGVSRWDTCAAEAILEAHGGTLVKLSAFAKAKALEHYQYRLSHTNSDFECGLAVATPMNKARTAQASALKDGDRVHSVDHVLPYSNLCGLVALTSRADKDVDALHGAVDRVASRTPPVYS